MENFVRWTKTFLDIFVWFTKCSESLFFSSREVRGFPSCFCFCGEVCRYSYIHSKGFGPSSVVEHSTREPTFPGSNPARSTHHTAPFSDACSFRTLVKFLPPCYQRHLLQRWKLTTDAIYSLHHQTQLSPVFIHTLLITGYSPVLPARDTESRDVEKRVNQATTTKHQQH